VGSRELVSFVPFGCAAGVLVLATAAEAAAEAEAAGYSGSVSGSDDIIHDMAKSWEKTSSEVTAMRDTTSSSTNGDGATDYVKKWDLGSEAAPADSLTKTKFSWDQPAQTSASSSSTTATKDGALAEVNDWLGKTDTGMWIQKHAQGFKGKHRKTGLVSIRLHKTETKKKQ